MDIIQVGLPSNTPIEWRLRIERLNRELFNFPVNMISPEHWWWVIRDGHQIAGFAGLCEDNEETAFIGPCGIAGEYRGRGLQRTLIVVRENLARWEGYLRTVSFTNIDNYASANNFIRCGYTIGPPWKPFSNVHQSLFWQKQLRESQNRPSELTTRPGEL
jgi:RimJ/RimL family protein N-acetyltransferase